MKFCSKCGTQAVDNAVFCEKCGVRFDIASQQIDPNVVSSNSNQAPVFDSQQNFGQNATPVQQVPQTPPVSYTANADNNAKPNKKKKLVIAISAGTITIFLAVIFLVAILSGNNNDNNQPIGDSKPTNDQATSSLSSPTEVAYNPIETFTMSEDLFDFTVKIDGDVFKLPVKLEVFQSYGWVAEDDLSGTFSSGQYNYFTFARNGKKARMCLANLSDEARDITKATVIGFMTSEEGDEYAEFELAKGIKFGSTKEDVLAAFGEPSDSSAGEGEYTYFNFTYYYEQNGKTDYNRSVHIDTHRDETGKNVIHSISMDNAVQIASDKVSDAAEVFDEITDKERQYKTPAALGNDLTSFNVEIEGDLYRIPAPVSAFLKNGWQFKEKSSDSLPANTKSHGFSLVKDSKELTGISLQNYSNKHLTVENCFVVELSVSSWTGIDVKLPGGITFGTSKSELLKLHGNVLEKHENETYDIQYTCRPNESYSRSIIYIKLDINDELKDKVSYISIENVED